MKVKWKTIAARAAQEVNLREAFTLLLDGSLAAPLHSSESLVDLLPEDQWFKGQEGPQAPMLRKWLWENGDTIRGNCDEKVVVWFAHLEGVWYGGLAKVMVEAPPDARVLVGTAHG